MIMNIPNNNIITGTVDHHQSNPVRLVLIIIEDQAELRVETIELS